MRRIRCAIYTRKSSDEGLEQDFNSLDAQREACAAYVLSQASEGWVLNPEAYDDGGLSGGTLERPALQRLLADVDGGRVDIIVVYKVDRLTRSLLDFARLVEALDKAGTSFVSVTQSFNTTTSMGRLTLNMLLSFAQFEREVTAERIRDKIAASKAKGMWMGGTPPMGYRPDGRTLAVIPEHAALIRAIHDRYLELGTVRRLADWLRGEGITTPPRTRGTGQAYGGRPFSRGQLYAILRNPVYTGRIAHKDKVYPGNHPAIITSNTWDAVQRQLADHSVGGHCARARRPSPLSGKIVDGAGNPLIASHASKREEHGGKRRYRYYIGKLDESTVPAPTMRIPARIPMRIPAREIEQVVAREVAALFDDPVDLAARAHLALSGPALASITRRCRDLACDLRESKPERLRQLVRRVAVHDDALRIEIDTGEVATVLGLSAGSDAPAIALAVPARLTRAGRAMRLIHGNGGLAAGDARDGSVIKLIARARRWWTLLCQGDVEIKALAASERVTASYMTRVVRLAFLSPEVISAALDGKLRAGIDGAALLATGAIPECWKEQARGFLPAV
ncbi:MAG TPA: recombinase family protein [Novosphingobium sp.]|nr:recombinase family protein [Novosphingobium sp.]